MEEELLALAVKIQELGQEILGIMLIDSESWKSDRLGGLFGDYEDAHRRIRLLASETGTVNLPRAEHRQARKALQAALLRELPLDRLLAAEGATQRIDFTDEELEPVVERYHEWFSHYDYASNKLNGAFLVLRVERLPSEAAHFVDEIVECYAFKRYTAVYALARVALESSLRGIYRANGLADSDSTNSRSVRDRVRSSALSKDDKKRLTGGRIYSKLTLDDFSPTLDQMIRRLCFLTSYGNATVISGMTGSEPLETLLNRVRDRGNSVLHGNRVADASSAREMMNDLFRAVHALHEVSAAEPNS